MLAVCIVHRSLNKYKKICIWREHEPQLGYKFLYELGGMKYIMSDLGTKTKKVLNTHLGSIDPFYGVISILRALTGLFTFLTWGSA